MAKNLIPEICKMLGVEIGENFKIKGDGHTYSIKLDGLHSDQYAMEDDYATLHDDGAGGSKRTEQIRRRSSYEGIDGHDDRSSTTVLRRNKESSRET